MAASAAPNKSVGFLILDQSNKSFQANNYFSTGSKPLHGKHLTWVFAGEPYVHPTKATSLITGRLYLFGGVEWGGAFDSFRTAHYAYDATGGILIVSPIGPLSIGVSIGDGGNTKAYLSIGRFY